jgi:iron complex transport system substrate-binding protein
MDRRHMLSLGAALLGASATAAAAAPAPAAFPCELTDALGRRVRIERAPQRLVVIFPSNVELAWALGLADRVAAIGGSVRWPEAAQEKPRVGGALGYSAEAVAAHRPDLIVLTPSHQSALGLIAPFERLGVPVLVLAHPDLPAVLRNLDLLGQATGTQAQAQAVRADMQARLHAVAERVRGRPVRSVYLETAAAARGAFQTMGTGHYANDALRWAGGRNVFADLDGAQQVSGEAIFARDPEVIISLQKTPKSPDLIAARPGWHTLRAVRTGRVVVLERSHRLIPGPRQIEAVEAYARAIHPEAFA